MATADGGYEGGLTGGKFRKRPFRKAASATPYDRPPALDRALRNRNGGQGERNRWFSKIVDPASRLINYGASMFFSSVFRKRLAPAPPPTPAPAAGADVSSFIEETAQATDVNLNEQVRDENSTDVGTLVEDGIAAVIGWHKSAAQADDNIMTDLGDVNPMPEVMQLGVMDDTQGNSGAVAISDLELLLKQKTFTRGEYDRLTDLMRSRTIDLSKENEIKKTELDKLKVHFEEPERTSGLRLNGTGISSPGESINVIEEEFASPMELAKSFMGSRSSQPALPAPTLPCSSLRETATLQSSRKLSPNLANNLVTPRSKVSFAGLGENGSRAPRTYGRSVLYKMSRSPYFKSQSVKSLQGTRPVEGNDMPASHLISLDAHSGGKQVLKRRNSYVEDDSVSLGPTRSIRQKSNMGFPLKEELSYSGKFLSAMATNALQGSTASPLQPLWSNGSQKNISYKSDATGANRCSVPKQSSLMARKILQQLDQLVPSPKGKSIESSTIVNTESPFKLTFNMLNGKALNSVRDIDYSKMNAEVNEKFGNGTCPLKPSSTSQMQVITENNESLKLPETHNLDDASVSVGNNNIGAEANKPVILSSVASIQKKPSFQMQAPESSWDLDMDNYGSGMNSDFQIKKENSKPPILKTNHLIVETPLQEKPSASFGKWLDSKSTSRRDENFPGGISARRKVNEESSFQKTQAFLESSSHEERVFGLSSQKGQRSIPLAPAEENNTEPSFSFGLKSGPTVKFSTDFSSFNNSADLNSEPKLGVSASRPSTSNGSTMRTNQTGTFDHLQGKKTDIVQESSMSSAPLSFAFPATSPSNVPQKVSDSPSVSASPPVLFEDGFGRKEISSASISSSATVNKCDVNLESMDSKESPFGLISSMAQEAAPTPSSGSGLLGFSFTAPSSAEQSGSGPKGSTSQFESTSLGFTSSDFGLTKAASKQFPFDSNLGSGQSSSISFGANAPNSSSQTITTPTFGTGFVDSFQSATADAAAPTFGASATNPPSAATFTFGVSASNPQPTATSTFGLSTPSSQSSAVSIFGVSASNSQPASTSTVTAPSSQSSATSIFGMSASNSHPPATSTFGVSAPSSQSSAAPMFSMPTSNPQPSSPSTFSVSAPSSQSSAAFIFGVSASNSQPASTSTFGVSAPTSQSSAASIFGISTSNSKPTAAILTFGVSGSQSDATPSFGASASTSQSTTTSTFGLSAFSSKSTATPTFGVSASTSHSFVIPAFGVSASNSPSSSAPIFGSDSSSQSATPPVFGSGFASASTPTFGSATSVPAFSFSSVVTGTKTTLPTSPFGFGMQAQPVTFGSSSMPGNTQMNEDSMTEDTVPASLPIVSSFGQTVASANGQPSVNFSSPTPQPGFQFNSQPNPSFPQAPQFQGAGGSFSLGSGGGGDKSNRRIVKPMRNKFRKK